MATEEEKDNNTNDFIDQGDEEQLDISTTGNKNNKEKQSSVETRTKINQRERRRMHDLNVAMDALREVMPYANGPTVRKLSKIATLSLARNYIQMLTKSVEELRHMLNEAYRTRGSYTPYHRMITHAQPPSWSIPSRDYRTLAPYRECSPSPIHTSCGASFGNAYSCCTMLSSSENPSSLELNGLQPRR